MHAKKIHQFLSSYKKMHTKENWYIFFCVTVYSRRDYGRQLRLRSALQRGGVE